jgi:hypothetical protein
MRPGLLRHILVAWASCATTNDDLSWEKDDTHDFTVSLHRLPPDDLFCPNGTVVEQIFYLIYRPLRRYSTIEFYLRKIYNPEKSKCFRRMDVPSISYLKFKINGMNYIDLN